MRTPPGRSSRISPLVPAGTSEDRDLGSTLEHLREELLDLRVGGEGLDGSRRLPLVDPQEFPRVRDAQVDVVRDVSGLDRHLLRRRGHLVVDALDRLRIVPELPLDRDQHHGVLPSSSRSGLVGLELRDRLLPGHVEAVFHLGVRLDDRDQVLLRAAGIEAAFALDLLDHGSTSSSSDTRDDGLAEPWRTVTVRVYLTGNIAVEDGDLLVSERSFPARQGRLAFAVLAWERRRAISTEEFADILWDGEPPDAWQTALRALVSKLRASLG